MALSMAASRSHTGFMKNLSLVSFVLALSPSLLTSCLVRQAELGTALGTKDSCRKQTYRYSPSFPAQPARASELTLTGLARSLVHSLSQGTYGVGSTLTRGSENGESVS